VLEVKKTKNLYLAERVCCCIIFRKGKLVTLWIVR
jgi:hypothetical protein